MKLKTIALAALLAANGASAAPALQTCSPMEVTHNGAAGLSYSLACDAGGWSLKYSGSVPAGTESVMARYRVQVRNPDGSNFTQNRSVRLPSPSLLGQALVREAVVLDNGDLALRDCAEFNCTLYRPLGNADKLAKATITVTPEIKRLADDAARLNAELVKRQGDLDAQNGRLAALQLEVSTLTAKLGGAEKSLAQAKTALTSAKEQYTADVDGLLASGKTELQKAASAAGAQSATQIAALNAQLATVTAALDASRKELAECAAAHQVAEAAKAKADAEVDSRGKQVVNLKTSLADTEAKLKSVLDGFDAKVADLTGKQAQAATAQSAATAAQRLKVDAANHDVEKLLSKVAGLERALEDANKQLSVAQAAQAEHASVLTSAGDSRERQRAVLETALAEAQNTIAEMTRARSAQVGELQASLTGANQKLAAAQAQLTAVAKQPAAPVGAPAELAAAMAQVDQLTQKVSGLEQALSTADQALAEAQRVRTASDTAYADLAAAADQNLQQLGIAHIALIEARSQQAGTEPALKAELASQGEQLKKALFERDAARADAKKTMSELDAMGPKVAKLAAERQNALKGQQQVSKDMLEALDQFQLLQAAKEEADAALASTTNKLMDLSTKLEAAQLARELAMQAATTANADADTQNLKNKELAQRLARTDAQLAAVGAERDALAAKLQAAQVEPQSAAKEQPADPVGLAALQQSRINALERANSQQARELAVLRRKVSSRKVKKSHVR